MSDLSLTSHIYFQTTERSDSETTPAVTCRGNFLEQLVFLSGAVLIGAPRGGRRVGVDVTLLRSAPLGSNPFFLFAVTVWAPTPPQDSLTRDFLAHADPRFFACFISANPGVLVQRSSHLVCRILSHHLTPQKVQDEGHQSTPCRMTTSDWLILVS